MTNQTNNTHDTTRTVPHTFANRFARLTNEAAFHIYQEVEASATVWEDGFRFYVHEEVAFLIEVGEFEVPEQREAAEADTDTGPTREEIMATVGEVPRTDTPPSPTNWSSTTVRAATPTREVPDHSPVTELPEFVSLTVRQVRILREAVAAYLRHRG